MAVVIDMLTYLDAMPIQEFVGRLQVAEDDDTMARVAINADNTGQLLLPEAKREVRPTAWRRGEVHGEGAWHGEGSRDGDREHDDEAAAKTRGMVGAATEVGAWAPRTWRMTWYCPLKKKERAWSPAEPRRVHCCEGRSHHIMFRYVETVRNEHGMEYVPWHSDEVCVPWHMTLNVCLGHVASVCLCVLELGSRRLTGLLPSRFRCRSCASMLRAGYG